MCVIGALFIDNPAVIRVVDRLKSEDFYYNKNRKIYDIITKLYTDKGNFDIVTVHQKLVDNNILDEVGGATYLSTISSFVPTSGNIEHYADIVREKSNLRKIISACSGILAHAYQSEYDQIPQAINDQLLKVILSNGFKTNLSSMGDIIKENIEYLKAIINKTILPQALFTGYYDLDEKISGFHNGEYIVLAARPSMGKTALAMNIILNAIEDKVPTLFFSIEMSESSIAERLVSMKKKIPLYKIRKGLLTQNDLKDIEATAKEISELPLYIDDTAGLDYMEFSNRCRKYKQEKDIKFIVIDYMQLLRGFKGETTEQVASNTSKTIKNIAKGLNIPILALSQLNRQCEQRKSKRPLLSDLRDSGSIEQDADVVLFIYREKMYNPNKQEDVADIVIAKQRNGPRGIIRLLFNGDCVGFENLSKLGLTDEYNPHYTDKEPVYLEEQEDNEKIPF